MSGALTWTRAWLAEGFRACVIGALWLAALIAVAADVTDPLRPESIRRPREWAWRVLPVPARSTPDAASGHPEP